MPGVFVSYRREDTGGHAGRLWEELSERYGDDLVFWDLERIRGGAPLEERLSEAVTDCDVLVALIGPRWVEARGGAGARRLDDPGDYVRREVAWALGASARRVPVLPVLVEGARMPAADELPDDLRALADIAALELRNRSWPYDVDLLTTELDAILWPPPPEAHGVRLALRRARQTLAGTPRAAQRTTLAAIALAAVVVALVVERSGALDGLELLAVDARYSLRSDRAPPPDIVLVGFDEQGLTGMGETIPPDRRVHARLIDRLSQAEPAVIVYDIVFTEPKTDAEDLALLNAIGRAADKRPFVLAARIAQGGETKVMGSTGDDLRARTGAVAAPAFTIRDPKAVLRRVNYTFHGIKTFAVTAAEAAARHPIEPFDLGGRDPWIDFAGPPRTYPVVPFGDALAGAVPAERLRGKVVVVGNTDTALRDIHWTPMSDDEAMSGPEILANELDTLRRAAPLRSASGTVDRLLVVLLAVLGPLIALRWSAVRGQIAALAAALVFLLVAQLAFSGGVVLEVAPPLLATAIALAGLLFVRERRSRHRKLARRRAT